MIELPIPLKVAIMDAEDKGLNAGFLKEIIGKKAGVTDVMIFSQIQNAEDLFRHDKFNCLFIDIFNIGADVEAAIRFIKIVRKNHPVVPICLYSLSAKLKEMPGVNDYWRNRFRRYLKLEKDQHISVLITSTEEKLYHCAHYIENRIDNSMVEDVKSRKEQLVEQEKLEQREEDVKSLKDRLSIHRGNIRYFKEQEANQGTNYSSPSIFNSIRDAREKIKDIKSSLRKLNVEVEDLPSDE